jgi:predicted P-loop ATPase
MYAKIDSYIRKNGYSKKSPNKQIFLSALSNLAQREYNPIKETLENTKWDGVSRLDSLCLCLKDKHNVGSTYLYHWMLGAIERVYNTYQNPILVLDGPQKIGKSSLVNFLGQPFKKYYVADGSLDPDNKDDKLAMCENFIYNWEEGASFSKRQMESVKSLVFSESQRIRRSYGKYDEDFKLNASIIMPKNQGEFLTDVTGNRRYNIVQLDVIDFSYNQFDSLQVWAEAYHIWQEDKAKNWQKIDTQKRDEINESMMVTPALYDTLDIVLVKGDESDFVSNNDLYNELQRRDRTFDRNKMSKTIVNYCITKKYERLRKHQGRGFTGCRLEILPYNY